MLNKKEQVWENVRSVYPRVDGRATKKLIQANGRHSSINKKHVHGSHRQRAVLYLFGGTACHVTPCGALRCAPAESGGGGGGGGGVEFGCFGRAGLPTSHSNSAQVVGASFTEEVVE